MKKQPSGFNGHCGKGVPGHVNSSASGDQKVHARAGEAWNGGGAPAERLRGGEDVRGGGEYTPFSALLNLSRPAEGFWVNLLNSLKACFLFNSGEQNIQCQQSCLVSFFFLSFFSNHCTFFSPPSLTKSREPHAGVLARLWSLTKRQRLETQKL